MEKLARCKTILNFPPSNLNNNNRYLGRGEEQQDFDQMENFRLDSAQDIPRVIKFDLTEEYTQIRIAVNDHPNLQFIMTLETKKGRVALAHAQNNPSKENVQIFTVLPKGQYLILIQQVTGQSQSAYMMS